MKKRIFYLLMVMILAILPACNKDRKKLPNDDIAQAITDFVPIPSIQTVTTKLELINPPKILAVMPGTVYKPGADDQRRSYALGVLQADLMLAAIVGNGSVLDRYYEDYIDLATALNLEKQAAEVKTAMQDLVRAGEWAEISSACAQLKQKYEAAAWDSAQYETYTLYLLGQWVEVSRLYSIIFAEEQAETVADSPFEDGLWTSIHKNMQLFSSEDLTGSNWFQKSYNEVAKLAELTDSPSGFIVNSAALGKISAMTGLINEIIAKDTP